VGNDNAKWWAAGGALSGALVGGLMPNEWPWFYQLVAIVVVFVAVGYAIEKLTSRGRSRGE